MAVNDLSCRGALNPIYTLGLYIMGIQKETSRRPGNRNQYLYVRSIGPGSWGTCPTVTQGDEWLYRKILGAALWTNSASTVWLRRPRWIVCLSEPILGTKNGVIARREVSTVWRVIENLLLLWSSAALYKGRVWVSGMGCGWRWVLVSSLRTRIETTKSPMEAPRVTTNKNGLKAIHTRAGKVILKFFFDQDGPFLIEFLQHGTTVNSQSYSHSLIIVHQAMKSKRPETLTRVVILFHDNARFHTAITITALLQKFKWEVPGHPPYSPDLSPCDYAIFGPIEKALGDKWFTSDDVVKQYMWNWFTTQPREFYETAIHRLMSQWEKCHNSQGQYFWHTGSGFCS